MDYRDFEVTILPLKEGCFPVRVKSPSGDDHGTFRLPFSEQELADLVPKLSQSVARGLTRGPQGDGPPPETSTPPEAIGAQLFNALFAGRVRSRFDESRGMIHGQPGAGLRIKLCMDPDEAPELARIAGLPWEYLYQPDRRDFLSLSKYTPVVRYLEVPLPADPLPFTAPLRILVVLASPQDQPALDLACEKARIRAALEQQIEAGTLELEFLQGPGTAACLASALKKKVYHVIHFMGHGDFDAESGQGMLCFEDDRGYTELLSAAKLKSLLEDYPEVRLVFLNACRTAAMADEGERFDAFMGVAPALVLGGVTAVVAMQFPISDEAAQAFSAELYTQLAAGTPVDEAVSEARRTVHLQTEGQEWGTPVLFMRSPDGKIFDLVPAPEPSSAPGAEALVPRAPGLQLGSVTLPPRVLWGLGGGFVLLLAALLLGWGLLAPEPTAYVAVVLDNGPVAAASNLQEVKTVLREELGRSMPDAALSLRVFGLSCGRTQRLVNFRQGNAERVAATLAQVQPVAHADLVEAIRQALNDVLKKGRDRPRVVVVVTWGEDGCGGDLAAALASHRQQLGSAVNLYLINLGQPLRGIDQAGVQNNLLSGPEQLRTELARIFGAVGQGRPPEIVPSPRPSPTHTLTPSSTPTLTASPTSAPAFTATWTPTPTLTLTPTLPIPTFLDHPWNAAWRQLAPAWKERLGGRVATGEKMFCVRQAFQGGFMFWCDRHRGKHRSADRPNVVFAVEQGSGRNLAWYVPDTWTEEEGQVPCIVDLPTLQGGFRKVWCENAEIREALLLPVEQEWAMYKVPLQDYGYGPGIMEFEGGYILWDTYASRLWVLIQDFGWKSFMIGPGTVTPSPTSTATPTATASVTPTLTATSTFSPTVTWTPSPTVTWTPSPSVTPGSSATPPPSASPTP